MYLSPTEAVQWYKIGQACYISHKTVSLMNSIDKTYPSANIKIELTLKVTGQKVLKKYFSSTVP